MCGNTSLNNSVIKRVLKLLEPVKLTVCKVITVVKFRMDYVGSNGAGCFEVKILADTAKFTNVIVAGFRKCSDLVRECEVFVKNKAKVASGVGCSERGVMRSSVQLRLLTIIKRYHSGQRKHSFQNRLSHQSTRSTVPSFEGLHMQAQWLMDS